MLILDLPLILNSFLGSDFAFILWPLTIPMWPILWLVGLPYTLLGINLNLPIFTQQIVVLLAAISVGIILGSVYGKIKSKKQSSL